jgi:protoheme IX farnesyltransferase
VRPTAPGAPPGPRSAATESAARPRVSDLVELTKPRITLMVVLTAGLGILLAGRWPGGGGRLEAALVVHALLGTALVSGGASALNQILERELDARMRRTAGRPLPSGRMGLATAWIFSLSISLAGLVYLALAVNPLTALLGLAASASYVLLYTPMKQLSSLSTLVGAVPGAIPPMMGWAAVAGRLEPGAWALFGLLFFWQLPHFLAIAWLCREEYGSVGFPMVPVTDPDGRRTARQMVLYSLALLAVSLTPTLLGLAGSSYAVGAIVLGVAAVLLAVDFARAPSTAAARRLMRFSIVYLPAVLAVLALDRSL